MKVIKSKQDFTPELYEWIKKEEEIDYGFNELNPEKRWIDFIEGTVMKQTDVKIPCWYKQ